MVRQPSEWDQAAHELVGVRVDDLLLPAHERDRALVLAARAVLWEAWPPELDGLAAGGQLPPGITVIVASSHEHMFARPADATGLAAGAKRGTQESNLARRFWRPQCYRYTSPPGADAL